jgi:Family of unknown function (DUF6252)
MLLFRNLALFLSFTITLRYPSHQNLLTSRIMSNYKILLAGCLSVFLLAACNKEITELPDTTQTGANTFGAKVDGTLWAPSKFGILPADDLLQARFNSPGSLLIKAKNFASSPTETEFELQITGVTGPGTYLLNTDVSRPSAYSYGYYVSRRFTPDNEWLTSSTHTGSVTLTKVDTVNKIVAGTFQFNALNIYHAPVPLTVTEGRFDIKLQ